LKTFKGSFTLAPGTIFQGYTEGVVENTGGRVVVASEPGGKNRLEGDVASMRSLGVAIAEACGQEYARNAPEAAPAPTVVGADQAADAVIVYFDNGTSVALRTPPLPPYDFIP
jgi:hypothetical protein